MSFTITKSPLQFISPAKPTPFHTLPLSFMDKLPNTRFFLELILVFSTGKGPAKLMREALAETLLLYYPVAGRLFDNPTSGQPEVACSDDGVVFLEASADCSLEDVEYLDAPPLMIPKEQLLPSLNEGDNENGVIFMMQVTTFACSGFAVGIKFNHTIFDGIGVSQFIKAIAEKSKGHNEQTIKPIWRRDSLPGPLSLATQLQPIQPLPTLSLVPHVIDISLNYIDQIKNQVMLETGGQKCTSFEIVLAKIWQARTRAINLDPNTVMTLRFAADVRREFGNLIAQDEGYYGNCISLVTIQEPKARIENATVADIVRFIGKAKANLSGKFSKWLKGDEDEEKMEVKIGYELLDAADWRRMGIFEVDYGWGPPMSVIPTYESVSAGLCFVLNRPVPRVGVRLMAQCVEKEHSEAFLHEMEEAKAKQ